MEKPLLALTLAAVATLASAQNGNYAITSFTPASGPAGTLVTITGTGLGPNTTSVKINGVTCAFYASKPDELKAYVASAVTTGPIAATGALGTAISSTNFTVAGGSSTGGGTTGGGTTGGGSTGGTTGGGGNPPTTYPDPPPHVNPPATALTSHPRMWVRTSDLSRLRGWAVNTNPIWLDLQNVANKRKTDMIQNKIPQVDSGDGEGNGFAYAVEEAAELFAFMSLVDPNATNRADWAKRAHDLLMHVIDQAALGSAAGQPFRTPHFATFNRSRWYGEAFPLVVDWCYSTFTAAEKAKIRKVFIRWTHDILNPNVAGGGYSVYAGQTVNNPTLTASSKAVRWSSNNYWCNHARNIGMMALALDEADDQPAAPGDFKPGYLRDYIGNVTGAWMYIRNYADTHDLAGGLSPEGPGYGESSFSGLTMLMLALHTAGYDDPAVYGPGAGMSTNPHWTKELTEGYLHSISPTTTKLYSYQPLMYLPAGYGDVLRLETIDMVRAFAPLAVMDIADNNLNSTRLNAIRWIQTWTPPGGPAYMDYRLTNSVNAYGTMLPILYFLMFDPNGPVPTDPRTTMSLDYLATGSNRILSRTSWGPEASWFAFISTWNVVDHQWGDANSFSFFRKGEFVTKEWSGYGKNVGSTPFQNNISIENPVGPNAQDYNKVEASHGSQFSYSSGDPTLRSVMKGDYVYAEGDSTNRFNSVSALATDVKHASRSILWLKPDVLVIYDRADSKSANKAKSFFLNFANQPNIVGNQAFVSTPKGQQVVVTNLLPTGATMTWDKPSTNFGWEESTAEEIMHHRVITQPNGKPQSVRFLHVLQGADAGATTLNPANLPAIPGYDGLVVGNSTILFSKDIGQAFTGVTFTAPAGTLWNYVTGFTPGAGYTVTRTPSATGTTITIADGGPTKADEGGVLRFRASFP